MEPIDINDKRQARMMDLPEMGPEYDNAGPPQLDDLALIRATLAAHGYPDDEPAYTIERLLPKAMAAIKSCHARQAVEQFRNTAEIHPPTERVAKYAAVLLADEQAHREFWDAWD